MKSHRNKNTQEILTRGNVIDLLLGGLSITFLRLAATGKSKCRSEMFDRLHESSTHETTVMATL